jgi:hypothetical protein
MGGTMIKNIIIIALLIALWQGVTSEQAIAYVQLALDKMQEVLYYVKESV